MEQPRILIADCSEEFLLAMQELLKGRYRITLCRSGKQALEHLRTGPWDMLLLDLILPELDGLTLLESAGAKGIRPVVLVATSLISSYVIDSAQRLNIVYLVRKPCDLRAIAARIDDLCQSRSSPQKAPDEKTFLSDLLLSLSLKPGHIGFRYLSDAISEYAKHPEQSFTKELYPKVGKRFGRAGTLVERSIRSALDSAWAQRDEAVWLQYFPPGSRRPPAATVIIRLSQVLRQWEGE